VRGGRERREAKCERGREGARERGSEGRDRLLVLSFAFVAGEARPRVAHGQFRDGKPSDFRRLIDKVLYRTPAPLLYVRACMYVCVWCVCARVCVKECGVSVCGVFVWCICVLYV
jgi:hypothetical protein